MATLRFLSALFLLVAVVAAVADATPRFSGAGPFVATPFRKHWADIAPSSLTAAEAAVTRSTAPWIWDVVIAGVIDRPTFVVFGVLALAAGYAGRRRRRINIYVN